MVCVIKGCVSPGRGSSVRNEEERSELRKMAVRGRLKEGKMTRNQDWEEEIGVVEGGGRSISQEM